MQIFTLHRSLWLPQSLEEVFSFFADIRNLDRITPKWLHFRSVNQPEKMQEGTKIEHRLKVRGIPVTWISEIVEWDPPYGFVDEQKKGPYRFWRHEHTFTEKRGGTQMDDTVKYAVPGGNLVNRFLIAPDLKKIFDYREEKLQRILMTTGAPSTT